MDERNLDFEVGELVEWIEVGGDGFVINDRGLGIVVEKYNQFYRVHRSIHQDVVNFDMHQLKLVNKK
tara:strand:- start:464 stop:664 length:201 start_codon:yes stop_codon:yes gene_type:complete